MSVVYVELRLMETIPWKRVHRFCSPQNINIVQNGWEI